MFEMLVAVAAAVAAALYGFSQSVFMNGPYRHLYRLGLAAVILTLVLIYAFYHIIKASRIKKLHVDHDDYMYYEKYTSALYRAGYFISYLIQNILFDYTYMRRNFNFCKGLDAYDGGVGNYYVNFRSTWYRYLRITWLKHKLSIWKLRAYASETQNHMILDAIEEEEAKAPFLAFAAEVEDCYKERRLMAEHLMMALPHYDKVPTLYRKNLLLYYRSIYFIGKIEPDLIYLVNRQNSRSQKDGADFRRTSFKD